MAGDRDVFRAPVGTRDVLPRESDRWERLVAIFAGIARRHGFELVLTPIYEHLEVFQRVGVTTDVVNKEMYEFADKGGRALALRPEGTAGVVRAFVQHRPVLPWKVWYVAPHFRHEKPQRGRYRQHWQVGVEALGIDDPDIDVEVIALAHAFYAALGLHQYRLCVNSMGDDETIERYVARLRDYWTASASDLTTDERERAEQNPMRLLDSKREELFDIIERAPKFEECRSDASEAHWMQVQQGLKALGIDFEISPTLVRGFDYYRGTVFEFVSDALDAAQNAIGGGGRYDRLAEEMGGPPTAGIGFGIGIERVLIACDSEGVFGAPEPHLDVFVVDMVGGTEALVLVEELRAAGLSAARTYGGRSVKKQWGAADKAGARYGVMLAPKELAAGKVAVKNLESGDQVEIRRDEAAPWLLTRLDTPIS